VKTLKVNHRFTRIKQHFKQEKILNWIKKGTFGTGSQTRRGWGLSCGRCCARIPQILGRLYFYKIYLAAYLAFISLKAIAIHFNSFSFLLTSGYSIFRHLHWGSVFRKFFYTCLPLSPR